MPHRETVRLPALAQVILIKRRDQSMMSSRQYQLDCPLSLLSLQGVADSKIERYKIIPAVLSGVVQPVLPVNPTDVWTICIDTTALAGRIVVPAGAITSIEELGLGRQMDVLATQATLRAGEWSRRHCSARHETTETNEKNGPRRGTGRIFK